MKISLGLIRTLLALGIPNLARTALYRIGIKASLHPVCRLAFPLPDGPFFSGFEPRLYLPAVGEAWWTHALYFGWKSFPLSDQPPDWHLNPFNSVRMEGPSAAWWRFPDFDPALGDIKVIWEASRFDWVLALTQHSLRGGQRRP